MKTTQITGTLLYPIYSPKGSIEGLLLKVSGKPVQVVCPPQFPFPVGVELKEGVTIVATVEAGSAGPLHKLHPLVELKKIGGKSIQPEGKSGKPVVTKGIVARLNYARHGEPNGVVLDNGDFVHTRPDNMRNLGLKLGDTVSAQGETKPIAGGGRVFEAEKVNGVTLAKKATKKTAKKAAKKAAKEAAKKAAKKAPAKKAPAKKAASKSS